MKLNILVMTISVFPPATARPLAEKRELGGVLICNGANSTGFCEHKIYELDTCYDLATPLYQNSSTFAPDGEGFYCYPYATSCGGLCMSPTGCTLGAVSFSYKFKFNLAEVGWGQGISSFECHRNETLEGR